jgi:hypothetical protein
MGAGIGQRGGYKGARAVLSRQSSQMGTSGSCGFTSTSRAKWIATGWPLEALEVSWARSSKPAASVRAAVA